jgi:hypothetical protein
MKGFVGAPEHMLIEVAVAYAPRSVPPQHLYESMLRFYSHGTVMSGWRPFGNVIVDDISA